MKTKTVLVAFALISVLSSPVFAGGRGCPGGSGCRPCPPPPCRPCRPCPPPPCRPYYPGYCGYRGSSGVRMAADIVSLVGASLNILRGPVVVTQPVVTQPVAVPVVQPVPCTPYYNNGYVPVTPICASPRILDNLHKCKTAVHYA